MSVTWEENPEFRPKVLQATADGLNAAAEVVHAYMKASVSVPGFGVPSPPYGPPHLQLGNLYRNIDTEMATPAKLASAAGLLENMRSIEGPIDTEPKNYALHLEFGTRRMAPRPFIINSLHVTQTLWESAFARAFKNTMGGVR